MEILEIRIQNEELGQLKLDIWTLFPNPIMIIRELFTCRIP